MKKKYSAFTLAEVLITLTILGVIAAITLPVLQDNVNKSAWTNGLKVAKGNIESAIANMMADYSADSLSDTPIWADPTTKWTEGDEYTTPTEYKAYDIASLQKYFKIDSVTEGIDYDIYTLNNEKTSIANPGTRFNLTNNSSFNMFITQNADGVDTSTAADCGNIICAEYAKVYIDVNGKKGPNTFGKDIYSFSLSEHGRLVPYGSEALNKLNNTPTWKTDCSGNHPESTWNSEACTARVIDEGYKINYLK